MEAAVEEAVEVVAEVVELEIAEMNTIVAVDIPKEEAGEVVVIDMKGRQ